MNVIQVNKLRDWKIVNQKIANGETIVLSYDYLFVGIRKFKVKKRDKYLYIISYSSQEEFIKKFISFIEKENKIRVQYSTFNTEEFFFLIKKIFSLYERYKKLSALL